MTSSSININNSLQSSNHLIQKAIDRMYEIIQLLMKKWNQLKEWTKIGGGGGVGEGTSKGLIVLRNVISGWKNNGSKFLNGMMKEWIVLWEKLLAYLLFLKVSSICVIEW
jgi:hypothetical protein